MLQCQLSCVHRALTVLRLLVSPQFRENPESTEEEEEPESGSGSGSDKEGEEGEEKEKAAAKKKDKLLTMDPKEITYEMVNRKMREIVTSR